MLAKIVLSHTKAMKLSYAKELRQHTERKSERETNGETNGDSATAMLVEQKPNSSLETSIVRVKNSKNRIYKSTIWYVVALVFCWLPDRAYMVIITKYRLHGNSFNRELTLESIVLTAIERATLQPITNYYNRTVKIR